MAGEAGDAAEARMEARVQELLDERARLWTELHELRAERRAVEDYERVAAEVTGSAAWKLQTRLREARRLAGRVRRKLAERRS